MFPPGTETLRLSRLLCYIQHPIRFPPSSQSQLLCRELPRAFAFLENPPHSQLQVLGTGGAQREPAQQVGPGRCWRKAHSCAPRSFPTPRADLHRVPLDAGGGGSPARGSPSRGEAPRHRALLNAGGGLPCTGLICTRGYSPAQGSPRRGGAPQHTADLHRVPLHAGVQSCTGLP